MYMFAGYASVCHSRGVCLVEVFAHPTCVFVYKGDCETCICACVSTDGAKMTKSTGVCSTDCAVGFEHNRSVSKCAP